MFVNACCNAAYCLWHCCTLLYIVALLYIACCTAVDCQLQCCIACCTVALLVALFCAASLHHGACLFSLLIPFHSAGLTMQAQFSLHGLGYAHKAECTISCLTRIVANTILGLICFYGDVFNDFKLHLSCA